jgi:monoamine oxidase
VQILEYNKRAGGRSWTLRGGDSYTELGGARQDCAFDAGLYINPGPWRIPFHHAAFLDYCRRFGVALEPFIQTNHNAYLHSTRAFGGKPQRYRHIEADFNGYIAELLAKAAGQTKLDERVGKEEQEILLEALRMWGALDKNFAYVAGEDSSDRRGYDSGPGGGLSAEPVPSAPLGRGDVLSSRLWQTIAFSNFYEFQMTMFQPVGGMDMLAQALARELADSIRFEAKVVAIRQEERGVRVAWENVGTRPAPIGASARFRSRS